MSVVGDRPQSRVASRDALEVTVVDIPRFNGWRRYLAEWPFAGLLEICAHRDWPEQARPKTPVVKDDSVPVARLRQPTVRKNILVVMGKSSEQTEPLS